MCGHRAELQCRRIGVGEPKSSWTRAPREGKVRQSAGCASYPHAPFLFHAKSDFAWLIGFSVFKSRQSCAILVHASWHKDSTRDDLVEFLNFGGIVKSLCLCLTLLSILLCSSVLAFSEAPTITSVTPTSGVAGTQVTLAGAGFGATQGSGNVWLGSAYGVVACWSDAQVVATVASGSKSGTAQILQGGVWSNAVNFTVATPNITTVTPISGATGTQVTITGTGFGATQGVGNLWLGSAYGVVASWSDAQVVATVASGSKSGAAQILQGGVWR